MKIMFKAEDGTMFESAENCVQYEAELANREKEWEAWGWDGDNTDDTADAVVVKLNTVNAAAQFLAQAKLDGDDRINGIEFGDEGWFYYDKNSERYILIDETILCIFRDNFAK